MNSTSLFVCSLCMLSLAFAPGCKTVSVGDHLSAAKVLGVYERGTDSTLYKGYDVLGRLIYTKTSINAAIYMAHIYYPLDDKEPKEIKGDFLDSLYGHHFDFYSDGSIEKYCYYVGSGQNCSYVVEFADNGKVKEAQGDPFVDRMSKGEERVLYFSSVLYDNLDVRYSKNGKDYTSLMLKNAPMQPFLKEVTVKTDSIFYLNLICRMGNSTETFKDTIVVNR
jgi:hypothetical protein